MDENVVEWFNKGVFQYYIFSKTDNCSKYAKYLKVFKYWEWYLKEFKY